MSTNHAIKDDHARFGFRKRVISLEYLHKAIKAIVIAAMCIGCVSCRVGEAFIITSDSSIQVIMA